MSWQLVSLSSLHQTTRSGEGEELQRQQILAPAKADFWLPTSHCRSAEFPFFYLMRPQLLLPRRTWYPELIAPE